MPAPSAVAGLTGEVDRLHKEILPGFVPAPYILLRERELIRRGRRGWGPQDPGRAKPHAALEEPQQPCTQVRTWLLRPPHVGLDAGWRSSTEGLFLAIRVEYPEARETQTRMPEAMRAPVKEVVEKALKLDEHGRAEVVEVLLKSLEVEVLEENAGFVEELDRRAAEMEAGTVRGIPWEEPWAELQRERGGS